MNYAENIRKDYERIESKVIKGTINGSPNIGLFSLSTDDYLLVPREIQRKNVHFLAKIFKVNVAKVTILESSLLGIFSAGNKNGILVPKFISLEEKKNLEETTSTPVVPLETKMTTIGNLVLCNNFGAIVSKKFERKTITLIEDCLDVEVVQSTFANSNLVGAVAFVTNKGLIAHPDSTEEELKIAEGVLKVEAGIGTANSGSVYLKSGIIANSNALIVGPDTTGPELARIESLLGFLGGNREV
jgi:translation initiation factor 6